MAHESTDALSRTRIREAFPWAFEERRDMIVGSDLDAIVSGAYLAEYLDWNPIGFYTDFENLYAEPGASREDLTDAVWVDLDVYHPDVPSIGHHVLRVRPGDEVPGHADTLNPNLLCGVSHERFRRKYPLGTIHFLFWLHERPATMTVDQTLLSWIPDSAWINGQSHRFRDNVRDWLFERVPTDAMTSSFELIDEPGFEAALADRVYPLIEETGFARGRGQITSRHRGLGGYQCSFVDPNESREAIQALVDVVADVMDWRAFDVPTDVGVTRGRRTSNVSYGAIRAEYGCLDAFLEAEDVFSYAIPNRDTINYTTGIDLPGRRAPAS